MLHKLIGTRSFKAALQTTVGVAIIASIGQSWVFPAQAQELIYQEDFETDGEAANPQRYTTVGRDVYEVDRIRNDLGIQDQLGPIYFAHNNEVSYTGVPAPTGGRRMAMAWDLAMTEADTSPAMLELFDSAIKWLLNNKTGAKIVVATAGTPLGVLGERLTAAGHTLVDDDTTVTDAQITTLGDMLFHAAGGSRGAVAGFPMLVINSPDADDVLTSSIGTATAFQPGKGTIGAPGHPAAGGKSGEFDVANGSFTWQLLGDFLPVNATILATFTQPIPVTVSSLADVEAMVTGTKQSTSASGQVGALDFNDATEGNWPGGEAVPGGATGVWGLRAVGKLNVTQAGTFTIASGADDGVQVRIDANKNGLDAGDTVISDPGPHGHTITYGNVTFPATGTYDIQVIAYNSGGPGSLELSVALTAGAGQTGLDTDPANWELLGTAGAASPVKAEGTFAVTAYTAAGDTELATRPLIMLLNGPSDTPPGSVFGGGPFTGQSGQRFFGGAGMNKWPLPDTNDRYLTLRPINVAGKSNVKLTIALAGTFLDFEPNATATRGTPDYLEVVIDTDGSGPKDFERLIFFTPPSGALKYVDDFITRPNSPTRLGLEFKDVTYDIPAGATDLVIEVRTASSWWNEIFAFDNIRITSGDIVEPPPPQIQLPAAANLKLWLSADKGVTATAGSVSAWEDQSGNLNNAAQSDTTAQPQLVDNAVNKMPVIRFDGANDFLSVAHSPSVAIAGDITTLFVVKFDDFATFRAVWAKTSSNLPGANDWYAQPNNGIPRAYRGNGTATSLGFVDGTKALKAGEYLIPGFDMAGTTLHHYLNGESTGEGQITATLADAGKPLLIGTRDDLFTKMKGDIAEIIIYDTALSDADRSQVVDYLANKYAIGQPTTEIVITSVDVIGNSIAISWEGGEGPFLVQGAIELGNPTLWFDLVTTSDRTTIQPYLTPQGFFRIVGKTTKTVKQYRAALNGAAERPNPVTTTATAVANVSVDGNTITYLVVYGGLSGPATAGHFHGPADANTAAGVQLGFADLTPKGTSGLFGAVGAALDAATKTSIETGMVYANIHTAANGGGEIRGQVLPAAFKATLNGAAERPNPVVTSATGTALLSLLGNQLTYQITFAGLSGPATAGHIHGPAGADAAAGVMIGFPNVPAAAAGAFSGVLTLTDAQLNNVLTGQTYVNIHTTANGGGEIRGQVLP